jgi:hypothetical protein
MRFFFPLELEAHLTHAGFTLERLAPFPVLDAPLDDTQWNVVAVARAAP